MEHVALTVCLTTIIVAFIVRDVLLRRMKTTDFGALAEKVEKTQEEVAILNKAIVVHEERLSNCEHLVSPSIRRGRIG